uniref:Uncharacterized protein n=1 Tax=Anguilla anguilla TaxID=7936 RepID=A0A0E9SF41_ANGAN
MTHYATDSRMSHVCQYTRGLVFLLETACSNHVDYKDCLIIPVIIVLHSSNWLRMSAIALVWGWRWSYMLAVG